MVDAILMMDPVEQLREIRRRHVYLARYMRVGPEYWERLPVVEVREYLRELSELIASESKTSSIARKAEDFV